MKLVAFGVAGALACITLRASAQPEDLPVIVSYVAPADCATASTFEALVTAEVARASNPDRPWRFSVSVRHDGDGFTGALKTEGAMRELHASTCDEVTAALATMIATAQAQLPATPPTPAVASPAPTSLPPPVIIPPPRVSAPVAMDAPRDAERRSSPAMLGAGIAMTTVGLAALPFGLWFVSVHADTPAVDCLPNGVCSARTGNTPLAEGGAILIGAGATLAVSGVVMMILGVHKRQVTVGSGPGGPLSMSVHVSF